MRYFVFSLALFISSWSLAFQVKIVTKQNLSFTAESADSIERTDEKFQVIANDPQIEKLIRLAVQDTVKLLPSQYLPPQLTVNIEDSATFTDLKGNSEKIPLSLIFSIQIPARIEIQFTEFEIKGNTRAIATIVSHETGHMLIEWACRSKGITKADQPFLSHLGGSIYEGIADYVSATVNHTSMIGGAPSWFSRDILRFKTVDEARAYKENSVETVEQGLMAEGLIPQYHTYTNMIESLKAELAEDPTYKDPYLEGTWLAGQLWLLNQTQGVQKVFDAVLVVASSGEKIGDPQIFLSEVRSHLNLK